MSSIQERAAACVIAPKAREIITVATLVTTQWIDLNQYLQGQDDQANARKRKGYRGVYITVQADGGDIYIALTADATTALTPSTPSPSGLPGNAGQCFKLGLDKEKDYWIQDDGSASRYLAFIKLTGTSTIRVAPSSLKLQGI